MRRISIIGLMVLIIFSLSFMGFAQDINKDQAKSFQIKPRLHWSTLTPFIIRPYSIGNYRVGITVFGLDGSPRNKIFINYPIEKETYLLFSESTNYLQNRLHAYDLHRFGERIHFRTRINDISLICVQFFNSGVKALRWFRSKRSLDFNCY